MTLGYVGLGAMGGALARRLALQHNVHRQQMVVHDLDPTRVEALVACGARAAASAREVAAQCDIILTCLPTSHEVRAAIFGESGLAAGARPGALIVDQTSGDPIATRAMAQDLAGRGIALIDAPVSGGPRGAEAGTIALMVGASRDQFARVEPILRAISPNLFHAGGVGAGHTMKAANNMLSAAGRLTALEGLALAVKNGVEPHTAAQIFMASSGCNFWMQHFLHKVIDGDLHSAFTLALSYKDVSQATQLGADSGVPMFFGNLIRQFYQMCINEVGRDAQVNTTALVMQRISGAKMIADPPQER